MIERIMIVLFLTELTVTMGAFGIALIRLAFCRKKQNCTNTACPIHSYCYRASYITKKQDEIKKLKEELQKYNNATEKTSV